MRLRKQVFLTCNLIPTRHKSLDVILWQFLPFHATAYVNKCFPCIQWQIGLFPKPKYNLLCIITVGMGPKIPGLQMVFLSQLTISAFHSITFTIFLTER